MPISEKKKISNKKYDDKHMTTFSVKLNNNIHEKLKLAVEKSQTNRNAYVTNAIKEALIRDGFMKSE